MVLKTTNGGDTWEAISPDLSRESYDSAGQRGLLRAMPPKRQATRRGVVYAIAPSRLNVNIIWAGTDDGLIHVTRDGGKNWKNVTPPALTPWSKVSQLDASHFDDQTVYAAINRLRLDDLRPHIYRTHDGGATWKEIVRGLPDGPVNVVREDPVRKGLLFAGNGTGGLRFLQRWRRLAAAAPEHAGHLHPRPGDSRRRRGGGHARPRLLDSGRHLAAAPDDGGDRRRPTRTCSRRAPTYRFPRDTNTDTPLPPEEPAGQESARWRHPLLLSEVGRRRPVALEILRRTGKLVRRFASTDKPERRRIRSSTCPPIGCGRSSRSPAEAGMHRFIWDLHGPPPAGGGRGGEPPISAIYRDTPVERRRMDAAGPIHRETDGRGPELHAASGGQAGPARSLTPESRSGCKVTRPTVVIPQQTRGVSIATEGQLMLLIFGFRSSTHPIGDLRRRCPSCHLVSSHGVDKTSSRLTIFFIPLFPVGDADYTMVCHKCGCKTVAQRNPLKHRQDEAAAPELPPFSVAGTSWLFEGTDTRVEFLADGRVRFDTASSAPHWTNGGTFGHWTQKDDAVVFDCNGFTGYEVSLYGDEMQGLWKRLKGPAQQSHTALTRIVDLEQPGGIGGLFRQEVTRPTSR